jgi:hypothetical protein
MSPKRAIGFFVSRQALDGFAGAGVDDRNAVRASDCDPRDVETVDAFDVGFRTPAQLSRPGVICHKAARLSRGDDQVLLGNREGPP